jgi:hypothetical protein
MKVHLHNFSKMKIEKSKRSHKTVGIQVFLLCFFDDRRMVEGSGSGRPKNMWIGGSGFGTILL